jgi:DDE family transposase
VVAGDILVGDRVYAAPPGVAHVVRRGGDVIVRLNRTALPLYEPAGARLELLPRLRQLQGRPREYPGWIKDPHGEWIRGRLVALRQSAEATRWTQKRIERRAQRDQQRVTAESLECAGYFMVWTTLPEAFTRNQILEIYRLRWQIELAFKRMKSILGFGHLPKTDPVSAQAWLEGKLFVALPAI